MKSLSLVAVLAALSVSSVFAADVPKMTCTVSDACQFRAQGDLGYCLAEEFSIEAQRDERGQTYFAAVVGRALESPTARMRAAAIIPVDYAQAGSLKTISGSVDHGDTWIELDRTIFGGYVGSLTMEQDFAFEVDCKLAN